jgi:hypothetical protein
MRPCRAQWGHYLSMGRLLEKLVPRSVHPSVWKWNSANFRFTAFYEEVRMQHHRADLLRSPEGSEVPEGTLERSLVVQPTYFCQLEKLVETHLVGIEQDFADHQSTTTLEHAA